MSVDQARGAMQGVAAEAGSSVGGVFAERQAPGPRARRRPRSRSRRRRVLLVTGSLFVTGAVWWTGWASPLTLVEHVVVAAPSGISEKAVRKASGISATDHVPGVDGALVRDNVMAALPGVAAVDVQRSLPDTITLTITAHAPFAALPRGDRYVVIDAGGVEFDYTRSPGELPVIRPLSYEAGRSAREVLVSLPADLRAEVRTVGASTQHDIDLTLADGAEVRWGGREEAALKAKVLAGLRSVKAAHYDVSVPLTPTTSG